MEQTDKEKAGLEEEFLPTRKTLLHKLQSESDDESWSVFFETYWKLIYGVALKSGLSAEDSEDVVQETVLSVVKNIRRYRYDPQKCSFKTWLMVVTRSRISNQFRKNKKQSGRAIDFNDDQKESTLLSIPDPAAKGVESLWEEEWQKNLMDAAIRKVKTAVDPEHFQVFDFYVLKGWDVRKVADVFHIHIARVYLIKHRISKAIKLEMKRLEAKEW